MKINIKNSRLVQWRKKTRTAHAHMTDIQMQNFKKYVMSLTQHSVTDLFNVCSNHAPLNYSRQESVYHSDIPVS